MDARWHRRLLAIFTLAILISACSKKTQNNQVDQTFPVDQSAKCDNTAIKDKFIVTWKDQHITVESAKDRDTFVQAKLLPHLNEIKFVEYDQRVELVSPFDSARTVPPADWATNMINANSAWSHNVTGDGVPIAVIDTGADITHPQLAGQIYVNEIEAHGKPGVDDDLNGFVDDINGWDFVANKPLVADNQTHGTHVSGIILADPAKGSVHGVAPGARLLPLAFLDSQGSGKVSDSILAMQYAISRGVKIINASWGGSGCSTTLRTVISSLGGHGILFSVAAGNDGKDIDASPSYPASFGSLNFLSQITVGASTYLDLEAGFSNDGMQSVALVAPGMDIVSTIPGNSTASYDGTSMATPFVSGAAALLWSDRPKATLTNIKDALMNGVIKGHFKVKTLGRLDVQGSLNYLEKQVAP